MANYQNNMRYGRQMNPGSVRRGMNSECNCRPVPMPMDNNRMRTAEPYDCQSRTTETMHASKSCRCRYDALADFPLAMAYVPWQKWQNVYESCKGIQKGTIFEDLWKPFLGMGGCNR